MRDLLDPWLEDPLEKGKATPPKYSGSENSMDCSPGRKESDMTFTFHFGKYFSFPPSTLGNSERWAQSVHDGPGAQDCLLWLCVRRWEWLTLRAGRDGLRLSQSPPQEPQCPLTSSGIVFQSYSYRVASPEIRWLFSWEFGLL